MTQPITDATADSIPLPAALAPEAPPSQAHASGAPPPNPNIALLVGAARDSTIDIAKLKELRAMIKEDENDWRKSEFFTALAKAKAEFAPIVKTRLVDYPHKDGRGRTTYKYEELADITEAVAPLLSKHGITHSFKVDQSAPPKIKVSCILAHANGYEDTPRTLEGVEDVSGQKSPNQAVASTVTFLERGTLKQALGLAAGRDDDGRGGGDTDAELIDGDQLVQIQQLLEETESNVGVFFLTLRCVGFSDMTVTQWKRGMGLLEEKKRRRAKAAP